MHVDLRRFLACLDGESVQYLVAGGHAVATHGAPRASDDLDVLVGPGPDNAAHLLRAVENFGGRLGDCTVADLATPGGCFRMGSAPAAIDLFIGLDCIDFALAWRRRVREIIDVDSEQTSLFIAAPDLIAIKQAYGRKQDLVDVALIRQARGGARRHGPERRRPAFRVPHKSK